VTQLNYVLDIANAGQLLDRLGLPMSYAVDVDDWMAT
jgi:hypothetical protein